MQPNDSLSFLLIVALKRTHKLRSKEFAELCYVEEQMVPHLAGGDGRTLRELYQFVYPMAKLSTGLKLHNVPALFMSISAVLEQPGVFLFHQDVPFRSCFVT